MSDSPRRLTSLLVAASLLSVAGFICGSLPMVYGSLPWLILCVSSTIVGAFGMYWAANLLRTQVQNERWPEVALAPFRRFVEHKSWKTGMVFLLVAMVASLTQNHRRTWFWVVFLLLKTQTQLSSAFARPRKPLDTTSRPDWSNMKPLQSEHWGSQ